MTKLINRMMCGIISIHVVFAQIVGNLCEPFDTSGLFGFMFIPIMIIFAICFIRIETEWRLHTTNVLYKNMVITTKKLWFWCLILISMLCVVGIMYYAGQLLLPLKEIPQEITFNKNPLTGSGISLCLCLILYIMSLIWIKKMLLFIWK